MAPCILRNTLHIFVPYIISINNIYTLPGFGLTDFELHAFECKSMTIFQMWCMYAMGDQLMAHDHIQLKIEKLKYGVIGILNV